MACPAKTSYRDNLHNITATYLVVLNITFDGLEEAPGLGLRKGLVRLDLRTYVYPGTNQ